MAQRPEVEPALECGRSASGLPPPAKPLNLKAKMVEAAGIEPVSKRRKSAKRKKPAK